MVWGGYASNKRGANYAAEGSRSLVKQAPNLAGIDFYCCSYDELPIPKNSLIYCDPPYRGVTKYKDMIDHDMFFDWCRDKVKEGRQVYLSEYNAPDDFECIFEKEIECTIKKVNGTYTTRTERLFKLH